jgi:hypothetical protein
MSLINNIRRLENGFLGDFPSLISVTDGITLVGCLKTVQKKFKKLLTLNLSFGIVASHTVTYRNKMRTKTLLLSAVALAAGLVASQAQSNVFSANVVGYVSVSNAANQYILESLPLDSGSNNLTGLFPTAPNGSQVLVWNGSGYQTATKNLVGTWNTNLNLSPGQGYFLKIPANATNTYVGAVVTPVNGSITNTLQAGIYTLVGSPIPYSDNLTGTNLNLQLANGSQVLIWNGTGYQTATKNLVGVWNTNLVISPGQGFFVKSATTTNWVQNFNLQ